MAEIAAPNNLQALGPWINAINLKGTDCVELVDKIVRELVRLANDGVGFDYLFEECNSTPKLTVKADDCWLSVRFLPLAESGIVVEFKRTGRN